MLSLSFYVTLLGTFRKLFSVPKYSDLVELPPNFLATFTEPSLNLRPQFLLA